MLRSKCVAVVLVLGGLVAPAQAQVNLQWKLKEGDQFYLEEVSNAKQNMKVMGQEVKQDQTVTTIFLITVVKKNADGSMVLEQKFESMKTEVVGGPPRDNIDKQIQGGTVRLHVSPKMEVTKLEGYDELVQKVVGNDAKAQQMFKLMMSDDTLKKKLAEQFEFVPGMAVKPGDKWQRKAELSLGPIGVMKIERDFTYEGADMLGGKKLDKIAMTGVGSYALPKGDGGGFPFKVTKGELKIDGMKGTIHFDAAAGRLVQAEAKTNMKGALTISTMGADVEMDMVVDSNMRLRVLDKPPK